MATIFSDKKYKKIFSFFCVVLLVLLILFMIDKKTFTSKISSAKEFITQMEAKTFDIRQRLFAKNRKPAQEIVIVGIDNVSHEYLTSYFGAWPMPRGVYADFINYVESQNPTAIGVDVLFVGAWNKNKDDDIRLANTFGSYDNLYGAIYFDDYTRQERTPLKLSEKTKSKYNFNKNIKPYYYNNLRELYAEFLQYSKALGHINLERSKDGVIRTLPLFVRYKNDLDAEENEYYANFALKILTKYIEKQENIKIEQYNIDKNNNLLLGTKKIPVLYSTEAILNWYNINQLKRNTTFNYVSFKDVFLSMKAQKSNQKTLLPSNYFKDKIVLLGFTADSLSDLKTVPTIKLLPGVEIYATFISNALDGSCIKKVGESASIIISLILFLLTSVILFRIKSSLVDVLSTLAISVIYIWICFWGMQVFYLWIPIVLPVLSIIFAHIMVLAIKYFFKSEDYEKVYKLAIYDALTGLYNHRFFQDQMRINFEACKRYGEYFSLIIVDIDKFKNFNDTYGHQVGDAVLRQVSQLLKKSLRKPDIICRYGGEEITIILPHTNNKNAFLLAEKLCKIVAENEYPVSKDLTVKVTISLGVSTYPDSATTIAEMIEIADRILYNAKSTGRNRVGNPDSIKK